MDDQKKSKFVENFIALQIKKKREQNKPLNESEKDYLATRSDWKNEWIRMRNSLNQYYKLTTIAAKINAAKNSVVKDKRADRALSYITTVSIDSLRNAVYMGAKYATESYQKLLDSLTVKNRYNFFINPDFVTMQNVILENGNVKQLLEAAKHPGTDVVALLSKAYEVADKDGRDCNEVKKSIKEIFKDRTDKESEFIELGSFRNYMFVYPSTNYFFKKCVPSVEEQLITSIKDYEKNGENNSKELKNI
ncbi:MAG: hypothetical protein K6F08_00820 [bacterium]|nr:hypothetical protein [bacterium]